MEFLVSMTMTVAVGSTDEVIELLRVREVDRSKELAAEGRLLRLWSRSLRPTVWPEIGLFQAADEAELDETLASMPLRSWRYHDVMPLGFHPHDPRPGRTVLGPVGAEFLTTLVVTPPPGTDEDVVAEVYADEGEHSRLLAEAGKLLRLWRLSGDRRALSHWQVHDANELASILADLPIAAWLTYETIAVQPHADDPVQRSSTTRAT